MSLRLATDVPWSALGTINAFQTFNRNDEPYSSMSNTLDSRQMLAFATLARRGSFTQAAKDLFLTQSAVSHTIKTLERDTGVALFDRVGKKVHLTQAGEQLLPHAERILREMQDARTSLEELKIGATAGFAWVRARRRAITFCPRCCANLNRAFRNA